MARRDQCRARHRRLRRTPDDLRALGQALGIDPARGVEATLDLLDQRDNWLLVFDNAEHPDDIRRFLPKSGRGRIIITSRYPAWGAVARSLSIGLWRPDEAASYLSLRTGLAPPAGMAGTAEVLGYLPLALAQAAGRRSARARRRRRRAAAVFDRRRDT